MYVVTVRDRFIAQFYLTVPNAGADGEPHSREYAIELRFEGQTLDDNGYLLDIDAAKNALEAIEARYTDELLNDLPEFENTNPSVERFCREIATRVIDRMDLDADDSVVSLTVRLDEDETAWAAYEHAFA